MSESRTADEVIRVGQIEIRFRLEAAQTAGRQTMFEFVVPQAVRVPAPHSHDAFDETIYGLDGVVTFTLDGKPARVGPGGVLFIPRGHVHHFENLDASTARGLSVITPGLLGPTYFREIGDVVNAGGPPDLQRVMDVMRRHGLSPVVP